MLIKDYAAGIQFLGIQPEDKGVLIGCMYEPNIDVDAALTILPEADFEMKDRLWPLLKLKRMSVFAVAAIINKCVTDMKPNVSFVNVGVWNGFSLLSGMAGNPERVCVGVDNFSEFGGPRAEFGERFKAMKSENHFFYEMDYLDYFKTWHKGEIGFYIYDGSHTRENQCQGLVAAEPFFSDDCLVLIDDINMADAVSGTQDFLDKSKNKYETLFKRNTAHNMHPTLWNGIQLMRRLS